MSQFWNGVLTGSIVTLIVTGIMLSLVELIKDSMTQDVSKSRRQLLTLKRLHFIEQLEAIDQEIATLDNYYREISNLTTPEKLCEQHHRQSTHRSKDAQQQ